MTEPSPSGLKLDPHIAAAPLYVAGTSVASARQQTHLDKIVKLASNESPLGPSPKALAAIQSELADLHRYPPAEAGSLYQALAVHIGHGLTPDHFVAGNGATEIIDMLSRAFVSGGENVIVCRPTFPLYEICVKRCGGEVIFADLDAGFGYDVDGILGAINERTRIVYVCTPNNPTGSVLTPQQADQLVSEIPPHVLLVFDESYRLFVEHDSTLIDSVSYVLSNPNVVSVGSLSKTYGLAGLRIGYAIAAPEVATYLQRMLNPFQFSSLALRGAIAALEDEEYVRQVRQVVLTERAWLVEWMEKLDLEVLPSEANFLAVRAVYPSRLIYERMLTQGVIIRPLALFYLPDWFRVTVGTHDDNLCFVEALSHVLQVLAEEGVPPESDTGHSRVMV
jgi:histidinol-phosphate aminotransferase